MNKKIIIGFTHGDTNGVGYELILKAFSNAELFESCIPVIFGSEKILHYHRKTLNLQCNVHTISSIQQAKEGVLNLVETGDSVAKSSVTFGQPSESSGRLAALSLAAAATAARKGELDALVLLPVHVDNLPQELFTARSQHAYLAAQLGDDTPLMLCNPQVRIMLATACADEDDYAFSVTSELLDRRIRQSYDAACRDFLCSAPRVAVLGSETHTDVEGFLTADDEPLVTSVIQNVVEGGLRVFGPYDPDKFFASTDYKHFDCVLAPNAEQGTAAFRQQGMTESVRLLLFQQLVCSEPDQDTCFDIAGKGEASCVALLHAVYSVIDICRNRCIYDEAHRNPLPFNPPHDRREERREERREDQREFRREFRRDFRRDNRQTDSQAEAPQTHPQPAVEQSPEQ